MCSSCDDLDRNARVCSSIQRWLYDTFAYFFDRMWSLGFNIRFKIIWKCCMMQKTDSLLIGFTQCSVFFDKIWIISTTFFLKEISKISHSFLRNCNNHKSLSIFIESMHDSWPYCTSRSNYPNSLLCYKSSNAWLIKFPNTCGMTQYSTRLYNDSIIWSFMYYRDFNRWTMLKDVIILMFNDWIINNHLGSWLQCTWFFDRFSVYGNTFWLK